MIALGVIAWATLIAVGLLSPLLEKGEEVNASNHTAEGWSE
jgi:hypothetical protein